MRCCFRRKKSRNERGATAVNEEYMEWHSQDRVNGLRHQHNFVPAKSEENVYIDPDEVPESVRLKFPPPVPRPPPPPPLPPPDGGDGETYGEDPQSCPYAVLDIDSLSKPSAPLPQPPSSSSHQSQLLTLGPSGAPVSMATVDEEDRANPIYSDIVGVLKQ